MKVAINHRWSDKVLFECELSAEFDSATTGIRLGAAVKLAYAGDADLRGADLRGADLRGADLRGANLCGANLCGADLRGADLRDANLRDANLCDANLCGANLCGANLCGANLSGADLRGVPKIENIHQRVYEAASNEGALNMSTWHSCETTHCRAGWVTHLAGEAGAAMEFCLGPSAAAALIYLKSDPTIERIPDFYCTNDEALADMKRLALLEMEAASNVCD